MSGAIPESPVFHIYTREESLADLLVHALGLSLAVVALPWMLWTGFSHFEAIEVRLSLVLYVAGAASMLGCSATYNWLREPRWKDRLRRLDRAVIFLMIAGTYSPLAMAKLEQPLGTGLMVYEWGLASLGATVALAFPRRGERLLIVLYLLMGWAVLAVLGPMTRAHGASMVALVLVGSLLYTGGVVVHASTRLKYHNALWHGCVLVAASCHYVAILLSVALPGVQIAIYP